MSGILQGKVALVTGGGFGLGRCSVQAFAREGARVVVADINKKAGNETVDIIKKSGHIFEVLFPVHNEFNTVGRPELFHKRDKAFFTRRRAFDVHADR